MVKTVWLYLGQSEGTHLLTYNTKQYIICSSLWFVFIGWYKWVWLFKQQDRPFILHPMGGAGAGVLFQLSFMLSLEFSTVFFITGYNFLDHNGFFILSFCLIMVFMICSLRELDSVTVIIKHNWKYSLKLQGVLVFCCIFTSFFISFFREDVLKDKVPYIQWSQWVPPFAIKAMSMKSTSCDLWLGNASNLVCINVNRRVAR